MKINGICFTRNGLDLALKIKKVFDEEKEYKNVDCTWYCRAGFFRKDTDGVHAVTDPLHAWTEEAFSKCDALIFIGATGIAVRAIAPYVTDKRSDPAVIVLDEEGQFCIPLLSGHIGGANDFAKDLAEKIGSTAVITTATDINHKFAVDVYAKEHDLTISNMTYAKEVSAALLIEEPVGFYTNFPVHGNLPDGFVWSDKLNDAMDYSEEKENKGVSLGIYISPSYGRAYFDHTLWLIPKCLSIGIGCKKGISANKIERFVMDTLAEYSLYPEAIKSVASIDIKRNEPGIHEFCAKNDLLFHTYSAEQLRSVHGTFTESEFVEDVTGVGNVCERSAVLDSEGELIIPKTSRDGITLAVAKNNWSVEF